MTRAMTRVYRSHGAAWMMRDRLRKRTGHDYSIVRCVLGAPVPHGKHVAAPEFLTTYRLKRIS